MKKTAGKLILSLFSFICTLLLAETAVRIFKPQLTYSSASKYSMDCYSEDDIIPFTLVKKHTCRMININGEFNTTATLNSLGYRGKEFSRDKKNDIKRILVIGDSMTFGWGVSDENTYPYLLEQQIKGSGIGNIEVINGGYVGGLSIDSYYVYLKNKGFRLRPDILILGLFVFNDISDISANNWLKLDGKNLPEKIESCCHTVDGRVWRNKVIDFKYRYPLLRESHLFIVISEILKQRGIIYDGPAISTKGEMLIGCTLIPDCINQFSQEEQKVQKLLREIKNLANQSNSKLLVTLIPVDYQIYPESKAKYGKFAMKYPKTGEEDFINKRLGEFLTAAGIDYIDLLPAFNENKSRDYPFFPIDAHFNNSGTKITASALFDYLIEKRLLE